MKIIILLILILLSNFLAACSTSKQPLRQTASTASVFERSSVVKKCKPMRKVYRKTPLSLDKSGEKYDLSLIDSNIREALLELSLMSEKSIIFDENVTGLVTVNIMQKSFEEALNMIIHAGPYDFKKTGDFYFVGVLDPESTSWIKITHNYNYNTQFQQPSVIVDGLSEKYKKYIVVDERKRILTLSAPRSILRELHKAVSNLDQRRKQVQLELLITELSQKARKSIGKLLKTGTASDYTGYGASNPLENATILPNTAYLNFMHTLQAIEQNGEAEIKARPSLMVMEGNQAEFNSNQRHLLYEKTGGNTSKLHFIDTGIVLKVVPYVGKNNEIILSIIESGSSNFSRSANDILEHKITTKITVKPSEAILFGGMMQERQRMQLTKVPVVGSLPLVGNFFKHKEEVTETKEVIFAIKPKVVCPGV